MAKTVSIRARISEEDFKTLKAILGEKTVSGKVAELIHEAISQNKNENGLWQNFERKIEALNANLSVIANQKQSGSQQSGPPQPGGQGKSPALDLFRSFELKYFTTIGDIYTLLRDIYSKEVSPTRVMVSDIQKKISAELNREPESKSKKKWFNKED